MRTLGAVVVLGATALGCGPSAHPDPFVVTARFPHDSTAYTQGLLLAGGVLFESTGRYGHSDVRRVDLRSGRVLARTALAADRRCSTASYIS